MEQTTEPNLKPPHGHIDRHHYVGVDTAKFADLRGVISTDLPGRFPITSGQGNAYIFIMHDYDSNAILAHPIQNRSKEMLIVGYMLWKVKLSTVFVGWSTQITN